MERIQALLKLLGNPQQKLRFIHIGGTNGKGSTAAFIASVLEKSGYRVGLYTSPYLLQFTNRMSINGSDIPPDRLSLLVKELKPLVEKVTAKPYLGQPTEFEVVTALAFTYFAQEKPDVVVLEVGLGGRLDATNVVNPLACVLTTVALDHTQVLGPTLEDIAREKAGIIKEGVPVVTGVSQPEALQVIKQACLAKKTSLYILGKDFSYLRSKVQKGKQVFYFQGLRDRLDSLEISLLGEHQLSNASLALACLELLKSDFKVTEESIRAGLRQASWPGRLEVMGEKPLVVLDGAHNVEAMLALKKAVQDYFQYERLILVLGILGDKDIKNMLQPVAPLAQKIIITAPENPRAAAPESVRDILRPLFAGEILLEPKIEKAVELALSLASPQDMVLVAGSLYTISSARSFLLL
ncbi:MAG: bifunctional folylpolyglutamate synthase/dihydrofolate synthase [Firmicutes bacterium]|nr:bifunctional folylpolyglutamate synthase/dihydrofolate synthase [Bacillota bacterium]